jgi:Ca2+-binding RTX toxin-like protein
MAIAFAVALPACPASAVSTAMPSCAEGPEQAGGTIYGTPCADRIVAPPGVVTVEGGAGDDTIAAAPITAASECPAGCHLGIGSQTFEGGPGNDIVYGERGNDRLFGGGGDDQLFGGIGDDLLKGGPGSDRLSGGFGADSIDGEAGDDYVRGDATQDTILDTGSGGNDTLSYSTGVTPGFFDSHEFDSVASKNLPSESGERGVYVDLNSNDGDNGVAPFGGGVDKVEGASFETVIGTPFSDYIVGGEKGETIYGGGGGDVLLGRGGNDTLRGGADGDHLDGGTGTNALDGGAGNDHCENPTDGASCESALNKGGVVLRDGSKVSVGLMAPEYAPYSSLYLSGSNAKDVVTATYSSTPSARVTFTLGGGSAGFDSSLSASAGCELPTSSQVVCPLPATLDSLVLAGLGGDDSLQASGFPSTVSVITAGGEGDDTLAGEDSTEDVMVDGPDESGPGDDSLSALGGDDALLNNGGADHLFGGVGNDLFLSNSICDGDGIDGGSGSERDNASWAKFKSAVEARIGAGDAGRPGSGEAPTCTTGALDSLVGIEDLEGTSSNDVLYGGPANNQLLGWGGLDRYFSGGGTDVILANSGDEDLAVECGEGSDTALVDRAPIDDDPAPDCENVQEADVNSFRIETQLPPPPSPPPPPPPLQESEGPTPTSEPTPQPTKAPPPSTNDYPRLTCLAGSKPRALRCAVRPRHVDLGGLGDVNRVHWQRWGAPRATGLGHLVPSSRCCGPLSRAKAKIKLGGRELCDSRYWYTRLTVTYGKGLRRVFLRLAISATPCS